jgi:hypothetical protein
MQLKTDGYGLAFRLQAEKWHALRYSTHRRYGGRFFHVWLEAVIVGGARLSQSTLEFTPLHLTRGLEDL